MEDGKVTRVIIGPKNEACPAPNFKGELGFLALMLILGLSSQYKDHSAAALVRDGHIEAATGK